jgi:hypothetical protein
VAGEPNFKHTSHGRSRRRIARISVGAQLQYTVFKIAEYVMLTPVMVIKSYFQNRRPVTLAQSGKRIEAAAAKNVRSK